MKFKDDKDFAARMTKEEKSWLRLEAFADIRILLTKFDHLEALSISNKNS